MSFLKYPSTILKPERKQMYVHLLPQEPLNAERREKYQKTATFHGRHFAHVYFDVPIR